MLHIPDLLTPQELEKIQALMDKAEFGPGVESAQGMAKDIKNNLELEPRRYPEIGHMVAEGLMRSPAYQAFALPRRMRYPIVARYEPGMEYGFHVDNPIMGTGEDTLSRTDVSVTVFLNEPDAYDEGELVLKTGDLTHELKLPAGHAFTYSTNFLHRVKPVTRGVRLVAVTWVQSRVRDHQERELLFELHQIGTKIPQDAREAREALNTVYAKMTQRWSHL